MSDGIEATRYLSVSAGAGFFIRNMFRIDNLVFQGSAELCHEDRWGQPRIFSCEQKQAFVSSSSKIPFNGNKGIRLVNADVSVQPCASGKITESSPVRLSDLSRIARRAHGTARENRLFL